MKKFFKIIIFLILSVSSFAEWKFDKNYDMIFTNSIKSEPSQKGTLYIGKGSYDGILNYHSLYILTEEYPTFTEEIDNNERSITIYFDLENRAFKVQLLNETPLKK